MNYLTAAAYMELLRFDYFLIRGDFHGLYQAVRSCSIRAVTTTPDTSERICRAMNVACIWYFKRVLCLQRSAATTCLLRRHGIPSHLVIGAQQNPFRAHAWVEVDGFVVNDKPYTSEVYAVLDRC